MSEKDHHGPYISPAMLSIAADEKKEQQEKEERLRQQQKAAPPKKPSYRPLSFVSGIEEQEKASAKRPELRMVEGTGRKPDPAQTAPKPAAPKAKPAASRPKEAAPKAKPAASRPKGTAPKAKPAASRPKGTAPKAKPAASRPKGTAPNPKSTGSAPPKQAPKQSERPRQQKPAKPVKKKRRRRNYTLYYLFFGFMAALLISILSVTILFPVEEIAVVSENESIPLAEGMEETYAALTGIQPGDNLLRADIKGAEEAVLASGTEIDGVTVSRRLPGKVVVTVSPAQADHVFYDKESKTYYSISKKGRVLEAGPSRKTVKGSPVVYGFSIRDCVPGEYYDEKQVLSDMLAEKKRELAAEKAGSEKIPLLEKEQMELERQLRRYDLFLQLTEKLEEYEIAPVTAVKMEQSSDIAFTVDRRIRVELGGYAEIDYKLALAKKIMDEELEPDEKGTLNLTVPRLPGFRKKN